MIISLDGLHETMCAAEGCGGWIPWVTLPLAGDVALQVSLLGIGV